MAERSSLLDALHIALELVDLDRHGTTLGQEFPESRKAIVAALEGRPNGRNERASSLWEDADRLLDDVAVELRKARERFAPFNSPHEGYAVILEELDELWAHVKANTAYSLDARREAIQIAAMAMRFALDCPGLRLCAACEGDPEAHERHVCGRADG